MTPGWPQVRISTNSSPAVDDSSLRRGSAGEGPDQYRVSKESQAGTAAEFDRDRAAGAVRDTFFVYRV